MVDVINIMNPLIDIKANNYVTGEGVELQSSGQWREGQ